jgi:mannan endo-1,4-beta-mannosidase
LWEPISEPEASTCASAFEPTNCSRNQSCPDDSAAAADLTYFFDSVGGEIHSLDPLHPVEAGFLGSGQCGTAGADYQRVGASPGIDVLSVHDYYGGTAALGGDQWNGLSVRFAQARRSTSRSSRARWGSWPALDPRVSASTNVSPT